MPRENNTLNNTVETQTENSSSKDSLEQKIESLGKEIKSLRKQNRGIIGLGVIGLIGYIIATNWSAIAPASATAATATVAAAPVIGIVIGTIIGAAVLVGASYAAWRYRAEIKAGFKYAAEKTVEGAKHTAGKIKAGAVYAKDSVKEAASSLKQATREGTSSALKKMGEGVQNLGRKMSDRGASISDLESIPYSTEPQEPQGVVLLAKREFDPDLIDSNRDLERDSLQSNGLPRSSSMDSLNSMRTNSTVDSTAGLLNPEEHKKAPTSAKDKVLSWFRRNKEEKRTTNVNYQPLSGPDVTQSAEIGTGDSPVVLPKAHESPTSSRDSGRSSPDSSGSSTPEERSPSVKTLIEAFDKTQLTGGAQPPSTQVSKQKSTPVSGRQETLV
ncbi:MAG: hypothetical protein LJD31_04460 [Wolbachia endosymbiont of Menacanthus eurysternus]|nr:hypothetical protein [Wolbachia endosymbiont of Menacanthus eurysternus]